MMREVEAQAARQVVQAGDQIPVVSLVFHPPPPSDQRRYGVRK